MHLKPVVSMVFGRRLIEALRLARPPARDVALADVNVVRVQRREADPHAVLVDRAGDEGRHTLAVADYREALGPETAPFARRR
eukprot:6127010-Prymnesium_polylepis.1